MSAPMQYYSPPRRRWPFAAVVAGAVVVVVLAAVLTVMLVLRPSESSASESATRAPVTVTQSTLPADQAQAQTCIRVKRAEDADARLSADMSRGLTLVRSNIYMTPGISPRIDTYVASAGPVWRDLRENGVVAGTPDGVAELVREYADANVALIEAYRTRAPYADQGSAMRFWSAATLGACRTDW